jgi:hypothetical protein
MDKMIKLVSLALDFWRRVEKGEFEVFEYTVGDVDPPDIGISKS